MNQIRYSLWLKKWHTRFGLSVAIILVMLCVTGILINHAGDFSLEKKTLPKTIASLSYSLKETLIQSETLGNIEAHFYDNTFDLYLLPSKEQITAQDVRHNCSTNLVSIAKFGQEFWVACESEISIFIEIDNQLIFIEQLNAYTNLPSPINEFGLCNDLPCLRSNEQTLQYQANLGVWREKTLITPDSPDNNALNKSSISSSYSALLVPAELNWHRWLLDLHAGRLFGKVGVLLIDLSAFAILLLIFTGICRWWLTRSR